MNSSLLRFVLKKTGHFPKIIVCFRYKRFVSVCNFPTSFKDDSSFLLKNKQVNSPSKRTDLNKTFKTCSVTRFAQCGDKTTGPLTPTAYEHVVEETLESLGDYMEDLMTNHNDAQDADVTLGDGVLTVNLGKGRGTYVINKQTPNLQIWLSSPLSGPKRYDFIDGRWVYKHDGVVLHELLSKEFSQILNVKTDFTKCAYG